MKSSIMFTFLTSIAGSAYANKNCVVQDNGTKHYIVSTESTVPDISGLCGGLWDNLKGFSVCSASQTSCGAIGADNALVWEFTVPSICNAGDVEAATWYRASENKYGSIDCGN